MEGSPETHHPRLGAALVFFVYPGREEERALLDRYHEEDA